MRYFDNVLAGVNVGPLRHQLSRHPELWNADRFRTDYPNTAHVDVDDILIRFSDTSMAGKDTIVMGDGLPVIWHPAAAVLTEVKPLVMGLMALVNGYTLERCLISRIRPGGQILRHRDAAGEYVNQGSLARYHIVVQGLPGSLFICGEGEDDETVNMQTGDVWSFSAHNQHQVINNSCDDRIHLMVDLRLWD